jgi:hypothetical protein
MIKKILFEGVYSVIVENDAEKQKTLLGVQDYQLLFTEKQQVLDHIDLLQQALKYWQYEHEIKR